MKVGGFELYSIVTGGFRLDGGAMFGVVPKVLWDNSTEADELNRIPLTTRTLLAIERTSRRIVLVDTGCGPKWQPKDAERFAIRHDADAIPQALQALGYGIEDVTDIVVTHLHFDHNGGLTAWTEEPGGATRLLFPRARHWLHERHWAHANQPHLKDRASFLPQDFDSLAASSVIQFVRGENPPPPFEGLRWFVSHGHTPYQLLPVFGDTHGVLFAGDLFPTVAHLRPTWVMAYDLTPTTTIDEKMTILRHCVEDGWALCFPHEPAIGGVMLSGPVERPIVISRLVQHPVRGVRIS